MNSLKMVWLLLLPVLLSGCRFYRITAPGPTCYYLNPNTNFSTIGRGTIVELDNNSSYPHISSDITEALFQALQKKQLFSLTVISQSDPVWRSLQLDSDPGSQTQNSASGVRSAYTVEQLHTMYKTLKCDAVLTGTITEYQPYPHMAIGLRLKLVNLKDGQLVWAFEQIWDTGDKTTERRIDDYFQRQIRSGFAPLHAQLVTVSSLKFVKFVAYEVGETLP